MPDFRSVEEYILQNDDPLLAELLYQLNENRNKYDDLVEDIRTEGRNGS